MTTIDAAVAALRGDIEQVPSAVSADQGRRQARLPAGPRGADRRAGRPRRCASTGSTCCDVRRDGEVVDVDVEVDCSSRHLHPGAGPRRRRRARRRRAPHRAAAHPRRPVRARRGAHARRAGRRAAAELLARRGLPAGLPAPRPDRRRGRVRAPRPGAGPGGHRRRVRRGGAGRDGDFAAARRGRPGTISGGDSSRDAVGQRCSASRRPRSLLRQGFPDRRWCPGRSRLASAGLMATEIMPAKSRRASTSSRESRLMPTLSKYRSISGSASEMRATVPVSPSSAHRQLARVRRRHVAVGGGDRVAVRVARRDGPAWRRCGPASGRTRRARAPRPRRAPRPSRSRARGPGRSPSAGAGAPSPARPGGPRRSASPRRTSRGRPGPDRRACGWTPTRCWPTPRSARRASWC